jgi:hypothetical protein
MLGQGQKPSWSTASCQSPFDRTQKIRPFIVAEQDPILFLQSILGDDTVSPSSSRFLRRIASPRKLHGLGVAGVRQCNELCYPYLAGEHLFGRGFMICGLAPL